MKEFKKLTEVDLALRGLIYAVETKDDIHPDHPFPLGEHYLSTKLEYAKYAARNAGIELTPIKTTENGTT